MENNSGIGITGILGILGIIFIVLKLCGVIKWSWLWVLSPFWIGLVVCAVVFIIMLVIKIHDIR